MSSRFAPAICFCVFLLFTQAATGLYLASGVEPSLAFDLLDRVGLLCLAVWWLNSDSRKHGIKQPYDIGLLLVFAWMLIVPHYLIKTRGRRGLLSVLLLIGLFVAGYAVTVVTYMLASLLFNP